MFKGVNKRIRLFLFKDLLKTSIPYNGTYPDCL